MSAPYRYLESCVPQAVSALLERPVDEIATVLWDAGAVRRTGDVAGGLTQHGTEPHIAADVLLRLGHPSQWWQPTGAMFLDAPAYRRFLTSRAHARVGRVEAIHPPRTVDAKPEELIQWLPGIDQEPGPDDPPPKILTLDEWRNRFPYGRWLIAVATGSGTSHALAVVDAEVPAGDGFQHRDAPIILALRVLAPKHSFQLEGVPR